MTQAERTALAMLRSGRAYEEAAKASGMSVEAVIQLWATAKRARREP